MKDEEAVKGGKAVTRRTGLLFTSAVALGLAGGAVTGFLIQQGRPATPLPPLRQALAASTVPVGADPHDPKTDDAAKLDGDLRSFLLSKPAGTTDAKDIPVRDWFTIADLAEYFGHPDTALTQLNSYGFRRAARTGWTTADGAEVEIDLVQFRSSQGASDFYEMGGIPPNAETVPGTATGYVGRYDSKDRSGEYLGYGVVRHGDVVVQVFVNRKKSAPTTDEVMTITQGQAVLL